MQVFCDFDGTISKHDVTDRILERFALPEWEEIERLWIDGRISSAECMQRQVQLIRASQAELDAYLDTIEIDAAFPAFEQFCADRGLSLTIVSDGVGHFIERVLANHGIYGLEIIANRLVSAPGTRKPIFDLAFPFKRASCDAGSGVCKCAVVRPVTDHIYIGDGRSDFCVSHEATFVFAKEKLADYCDAERIPFIPYDGFADIQATVAGILSSTSRQPFARAVAKSA